MRFIDEANIQVAGGHGGPGCVSFRRETFAPRGGPDGGDGGDGGSVIFVADTQLGTLQDFRFKRAYTAPAGIHGSGANKAGRDGEDVEIRVPVGTVIRDVATGEILIDFTANKQRWIACKGGRGGKGNAHFATSTFQAPKFAQPGEEGETRELKLELKLLADAALVGFPNAGKSTLIARISAARPKIADYAFTTLTPNLGVVAMPEMESFVVADIPGLIEGAHRGMGLGHKFLKHIERTRVFVHLLDGTGFLEDATRPDDPHSLDHAIDALAERYRAIRKELELFNRELLTKPEIVALNKIDVLQSDQELLARARKALRAMIGKLRGSEPPAAEPFFVSAATGAGVKELLFAVQAEIRRQKASEGDGGAPGVSLPDDGSIRT